MEKLSIGEIWQTITDIVNIAGISHDDCMYSGYAMMRRLLYACDNFSKNL